MNAVHTFWKRVNVLFSYVFKIYPVVMYSACYAYLKFKQTKLLNTSFDFESLSYYKAAKYIFARGVLSVL